MKKRLFIHMNIALKAIFTLFILLSCYFALVSENFTLEETATTKAPTLGLYLLLGILALIGFLTLTTPKVRNFFKLLNERYAVVIAIMIALSLLGWQFLFVTTLKPAFGFDPGALHQALKTPNTPELQGYFSLNQNNLLLLLVMKKLSLLFHTDTWYFFDLVAIFLTDLSALINLLTLSLIARRKVKIGFYLQALCLFFFPMGALPYSDTAVLPLVALLTFCYVGSLHYSFSLPVKVLLTISGGATSGVLYFIKPSTLIIVISLSIIELIFSLRPKKQALLLYLTVLFLWATSGVTSFYATQQYLDHQEFITLNKERAIPAWHYLSIGMTGQGGYDPTAALAMARLSKKQKVEYSKKNIAEQLHQKGVAGYLKFLFFKHQHNTSDGTFSWLKEGHFLAKTVPNTTALTRFFTACFYPEGRYRGNFNFLAQTCWLLCLLLIVLGQWQLPNIPAVQMLRTAICGAYLFLLLFEGGRSRYLIQFLPLFWLLASLSATNAWQWSKQKFNWLMLPFESKPPKNDY